MPLVRQVAEWFGQLAKVGFQEDAPIEVLKQRIAAIVDSFFHDVRDKGLTQQLGQGVQVFTAAPQPQVRMQRFGGGGNTSAVQPEPRNRRSSAVSGAQHAPAAPEVVLLSGKDGSGYTVGGRHCPRCGEYGQSACACVAQHFSD